MELDSLLLSERHRSTIITRTIGFIGWFIIIISIIVGANDAQAWWPDSLLLLAIGALFVGSHWFFVPRRYNVYEAQLITLYGKPRQHVIPFVAISHIQVIRHILGGEIRIHITTGRAGSIQPWYPQRFLERMEQAMKRFKDMNPESPWTTLSENESVSSS